MPGVSKFSNKSQTKSFSLPCRSHPTTYEIEELLNKIKTEATSADAICDGLSQLTRLYICMNNLLTSSTTQVLMSREQNKKWVDELVDESVKFLDICGSISDMISEFKDHIRDLYSSLRRKRGDMISVSIMKYNCFRKKMRKNVRGLISSLKQADNMITGGGGLVVVNSDNHQLAAMIRAVIGVGEVTVMVFESLLMFFAVPVSKPNRWSLVVSKLTHKGTVTHEDQQEQGVPVNQCERFDAALRILCKNGSTSELGNVEIAQCRLEKLEAQIETMESGLESMFRYLVQTRVSLLNIISQ